MNKTEEKIFWEIKCEGILFGIASQQPYFKVAIDLNRNLRLDLIRSPIDHVLSHNASKASFVVLEDSQNQGLLKYQLFSNHGEGGKLIKKFSKQFDYFLLVLYDDFEIDKIAMQIVESLKNCKEILAFKEINWNDLAEKENLIFETNLKIK